MTPGRLLRPKRVTRAMVRAAPDTLWVFGDNFQRRGMGGQAREMRGEPNAFGVPTKWAPSRYQAAYFSNADWEDVTRALSVRFQHLAAHFRSGRNIAIPADGLGTGLAELPTRAPRIHAWIEEQIAGLEQIANGEMAP